MSANETIAFGLGRSQAMLQLFVADLTAAEYLHRITPKANCAAWTVGHLILSDRRMLGLLGIKDLPALPDGFEKRFSRDEGCPQAHEFGDVTILAGLFDQNRNMLIGTIRKASLEQLDKPLEKPHRMFTTLGEMASFYSLHTAMHAGQITLIRRSLGRPPLI